MSVNPAAIVSPREFYSLSARWTASGGRPAGFDYLRIGLATSVLIWHSYQVSYGTDAARDAWQAFAGVFLDAILPMFFCLSGFLVLGSLERNPDLRTFLALRVIRIGPALLVEVVFSALVLGPIATSLTLKQYFGSEVFRTYFLNMFGWVHYKLPGVFAANPLPGVVNTSLWTVPYELECYLVLTFLVICGFLKTRWISLRLFVLSTCLVALVLHVAGSPGTAPGGLHGRVLILCFLAGAVVFRLRAVLPYSGALAGGSGLLAIALLRNEYGVFLAPIFVAYTTAYLGMLNPARTVIVDSGDYSYGIYLYAAPFQQLTAWALGGWNSWLLNVAIAIPTTVLFALLSWRYIERPFLKIKRYIIGQGARHRAARPVAEFARVDPGCATRVN